MSGILFDYVILENFKSFRGINKIGPFKKFTAIIGPNGSGKSNFMDAVCFVMGEKTSCLRVRRLIDLIHKDASGVPVSNTTSVTARFIIQDGTPIEFQRSVINSSSNYKINGQQVNAETYLSELESMGINVKAKNFLVLQGAVETIAIKTPKERTVLFEEISGSIDFKNDYERLKLELNVAERKVQGKFDVQKSVAKEKKFAKKAKVDVDKFEEMQNEITDKETELFLFRLYHKNEEMNVFTEEIGIKQGHSTDLEGKNSDINQTCKDKRKEKSQIIEDISKIEKKIRTYEPKINTMNLELQKIMYDIDHTQQKINKATQNIEKFRQKKEMHAVNIQKIESDIQKLEQKRQELDQNLAEKSQRRFDVHFVDQYKELKKEVDITTAKYYSNLNSLTRELESCRDELDEALTKKTTFEEKFNIAVYEKQEEVRRRERILNQMTSIEESLTSQIQLRDELREKVMTSKDRMDELESNLSEIYDQLRNAQMDEHDFNRQKKKQITLEMLISNVPGVHDRLINLCHPVHNRYKIAVTKAFGNKNMEAIVVDTEKNARQCIEFLKAHRLGVETFLPLDNLAVHPVKEMAREIQQPRNVKLLLDVLKYNPEIETAVLFVTKNMLVCETADDAAEVAFELHYNAVSLDGTSYNKSGIMSGGATDLKKKANRWDEKHIAKLTTDKLLFERKLKQIRDDLRSAGDLATLESETEGLTNRFNYVKSDLEQSDRTISNLEAITENYEQKLTELQPSIQKIERKILQKDRKVEGIKEEMNNIEDRIFAEFCQEIGLENIREYEEHELTYRTVDIQKMELDQEIDNLKTKLEFERSQNIEEKIANLEQSLQELESSLANLHEKKDSLQLEIESTENEQTKFVEENTSKKGNLKKTEQEISKLSTEMDKLKKEIASINRLILTIETQIETKKLETHNLLVEAKVKGISIPMTSDSIDFRTLSNALKLIRDPKKVLKQDEILLKELEDMMTDMQQTRAPNLKFAERLPDITQKMLSTNEELKQLHEKVDEAKNAFDTVKNNRINRFKNCSDHISDNIDQIYKGLTQNENAQAYISPSDPEEPYLGGITYDCVAPGKRFGPMANLSGGEKTVAALALLFAIHNYNPSPFFVFDEVDAALDNTNIEKVSEYFYNKREEVQTIVISHKDEFYGNADTIIGITPGDGESLVSDLYRLDLTGGANNEEDEG